MNIKTLELSFIKIVCVSLIKSSTIYDLAEKER